MLPACWSSTVASYPKCIILPMRRWAEKVQCFDALGEKWKKNANAIMQHST